MDDRAGVQGLGMSRYDDMGDADDNVDEGEGEYDEDDEDDEDEDGEEDEYEDDEEGDEDDGDEGDDDDDEDDDMDGDGASEAAMMVIDEVTGKLDHTQPHTHIQPHRLHPLSANTSRLLPSPPFFATAIPIDKSFHSFYHFHLSFHPSTMLYHY